MVFSQGEKRNSDQNLLDHPVPYIFTVMKSPAWRRSRRGSGGCRCSRSWRRAPAACAYLQQFSMRGEKERFPQIEQESFSLPSETELRGKSFCIIHPPPTTPNQLFAQLERVKGLPIKKRAKHLKQGAFELVNWNGRNEGIYSGRRNYLV